MINIDIKNEKKELIYRFSVEEINGFEFISTYWECQNELEVDRYVKRFETYSAALANAFDTALRVVVSNHTKLYVCDYLQEPSEVN